MICFFCGEDSKSTKEHAWPQWISTLFPGGGPFTLTSERWQQVYSTRQSSSLDLTVGGMCATCNNVRLGTHLEPLAKPLLTPMIRGQPKTLFRVDMPIIARWAVKTVMVFEFTSDPARPPYFTAEERRALVVDEQLPQTLGVWLAAFDGRAWVGKAQGRDLTLTPQDVGLTPYRAHAVTFSIGHLILQVFSHRGTHHAGIALPGHVREFLVPVWPVEGIETWPPGVTLDAGGFTRLVYAFDA